MKLTQISQTRSDCIATYTVTDYKATTVEEFINEVITEFPTEWGDIRDEHHNLLAEYRYGKIVATDASAEQLMNKRIVKIIGDGGWSCMDYFIITED